MSLYALPAIVSVSSARAQHGELIVGLPNVSAFILTAANYEFIVVAERGLDVHRWIGEAFVFAYERQVTQVVEANTRIVRCN